MIKKLLNALKAKPTPIHMFSAALSDPGQVRRLNEDNYLIDEPLGFYIVADGMGGHDAGEVASKLAVETLDKELASYIENGDSDLLNKDPGMIYDLIQDAVEEANNQIHCYNLAKDHPEGKGMGTTIAGIWVRSFNKKRLVFTFHMGDSRIYRLRGDELKLLSQDHSHHRLWQDTGEVGPEPKKNIIYKAIGPWRRAVADVNDFEYQEGDIYLLCSDGLTGMLEDDDLKRILLDNRERELAVICRAMIDEANANGGDDNITVLLASA